MPVYPEQHVHEGLVRITSDVPSWGSLLRCMVLRYVKGSG